MRATTPPPPMPRDRVLALIERMAKSRIVVVGDLILDRYLIGDTERLSPEAPVPVVTVREQRAALGGAANVAANVAAMGATCRLVGVVGDDPTGRALRAEMATLRLTDSFVETTAGRPTTSKTRVLARGQQVVRIDEEVDRLLDDAELAKVVGQGRGGAGRRRRAAARGLQQGAPGAGGHPRRDGRRQQARHSRGGGPQVPAVLRLCRRHRLQAQPPGDGGGARRRGGPREAERAARGAHPAQGGQPAADAGRRGNGAGDARTGRRPTCPRWRARCTTCRARATR